MPTSTPATPGTEPGHSPFQRWISRLLIVTTTALGLQPLTAAHAAQAAQPAVEISSSRLVEDAVKLAVPEAWDAAGRPQATDDDRLRAARAILGQVSVLASEADAALAGDGAVEEQLRARGAPAEALARHREAVADLQARRGELERLLQAVEKAAGTPRNALMQRMGLGQETDPAALRTALQDLAAYVKARTPAERQHVDPANLPWQVQKNEARPPLEDAAALNGLMARTTVTDAARRTAAQPAGGEQVRAAPPVTNAPTAADLAATLDAPQTAAIKQLAADLGHNPHKIYQWVHDHIHWFPSYGSVQGAQDTLDKQRGNAFDTASLLIALLRAANIPARYVYGTVDVPAAQVLNWVGGADNVDAAQQILGQGGIPNVALVSGGKVSHIRLEHVWVEAWVDYLPSRGAKHITGDTWVPMDGSYKQYTYTAPMDLKTQVPFDADAFATAAQQGATVDQAEGWVQNLDQTALRSQLNAYQTRLKAYLDSQQGGQATVGDVLGTQAAKIDPLPYLAGSLPYAVKATANRVSELPAGLRHQFRYRIYQDAYSQRIDASPLLDFQLPTASLAGKKVTIAWVAADAAAQAAIEALLPTPPAGQELQPQDLPQGLPRSIRLKPQLRVDGEMKAEGPGMAAGSEPVGAGAFTRYGNLGQWDETTDPLVAGQQSALGLSIQGVSQAQFQTLKTRMEATQAKLQAAQAAPEADRPGILAGLTAEHLTGDLLTGTIWGYFGNHQTQGVIDRSSSHMIDLPGLSYGLFHAVAQPNKLYGIVTTGVSFKGLNVDIGHLRHLRWHKGNDKAAWIAYNRARGMNASALEHATPEQFWVDRSQCRYLDANGQVQNPALDPCAEAVSAVKALAIAAAEGQKIFTITQANAAAALPQLSISGDMRWEIESAVQAGKEVTVHERAINAHGYSGYGYVIVDPETGGGAYLIEGKGNGAVLLLFLGALLTVLSLFFIGMIGIVSGGAILLLLLPALALMVGALYIFLNDPDTMTMNDFLIYLSFFRVAAIIALAPLEGTFGAVIALLAAMAMFAISIGKTLLSVVPSSHWRHGMLTSGVGLKPRHDLSGIAA